MGERNRSGPTQKEPLIKNYVKLPSDLRHLAPRKTSGTVHCLSSRHLEIPESSQTVSEVWRYAAIAIPEA